LQFVHLNTLTFSVARLAVSPESCSTDTKSAHPLRFSFDDTDFSLMTGQGRLIGGRGRAKHGFKNFSFHDVLDIVRPAQLHRDAPGMTFLMTKPVRAAVLTNYLDVAHYLGFNPHDVLAQVGLSKARLLAPEQRIPIDSAVRLLELATASGCQTFGLSMAESRQLGLWRGQPAAHAPADAA
jgi:hypothetical protein